MKVLHTSDRHTGVISQVASLKERIGTQIQSTPDTGGRSNLSGPGCMKKWIELTNN